MLTRLREIVEKVAAAASLTDALDLLVNETCLAMDTEVCSIYLADNDRRCYYLMATRGLKKPRGRTIALAFDEGVVGLVGRRAEPINLADAQSHPSFKYVPQVKEDRFRSFLGVPIIHRRQLLVCWWCSSASCASSTKAKSLSWSHWPRRWPGSCHSRSSTPFSASIAKRACALAASPGVAVAEGWQDSSQPSLDQVLPRFDAGHRQRARAPDAGAGRGRRGVSPLQQAFCRQLAKESAAIFDLTLTC